MLQCKCLRCLNLKVGEFESGIGFRCGLGFYDTHCPAYFSPLSIVKFSTVAIVRAVRECGDNFKPMGNSGKEIGFSEES